MSKRSIIQIDEDKCDGCGLCVPNCAEGAIQIINGKAIMAEDKLCDGLGACMGHCPKDALHIIEREADGFDEASVIAHLQKKNQNTPKHFQGCPGSRVQLKQWPIQFMLVPVEASYYDNADLLITADCLPVAYPNYHLDMLKGKRVIIGCPKLDDSGYYAQKLTEILKLNSIKSLTVAHMEVPCCSGLVQIVKTALANSHKNIPLRKIQVGIEGNLQSDTSI
jgi:NAD-dependent dihydropyrimidine dehydrogenase PreA subunit